LKKEHIQAERQSAVCSVNQNNDGMKCKNIEIEFVIIALQYNGLVSLKLYLIQTLLKFLSNLLGHVHEEDIMLKGHLCVIIHLETFPFIS